MVGKTISHYEITEKLGEGGMGVVYKAHDSRLKRFVALKVLPPEKVADPERKQRFVQEARAASALNHPNIITIHDIGEADGTGFIAMEYVEGKTLDELVGRKGLKLNEALKYAIQIADALAKAHAAGITHRDLKPGNVMVTVEGRAKVLDFGLAKLTEPDSVDSEDSTETEHLSTETGVIMGTLSYMSPEQAEGKKVDARSDIFSFGPLLYEMLTGRRPFRRDTAALTLAAVLHLEPPPLPPQIPQELERVVSRCLRKDISRRYQHMDDVKIALEELKEESDSGKLAPAAMMPVRKGRRWLVVAVAIPVLAVAGWLTWRKLSTPLPPPRVRPLTTFGGSELAPSFSPDGKQVAFMWNGEKQDNYDIYVKHISSGALLRLTSDPASEGVPRWSPDGSQIAFVRGTTAGRAIYLTSPLGGQARKLVDHRSAFMSSLVSWSSDSQWLAAAELEPDGTNGIFLIGVSTGERRKVVANPVSAGLYALPTFSPDGRFLAFGLSSGANMGDVRVLEIGSDFTPKGPARSLTTVAGMIVGIAWAQDGRSLVYGGVYESQPCLWRVPLAGAGPPERLELAGEPAIMPAISRTGNLLAYAMGRSATGTDVWRMEAGAAPKPLIASTREDYDARFSPDGRKIAFITDRSGKGGEVWISDADGTNPVRLTEGVSRIQGSPRWSPDGRWIAFDGQSGDGRFDIFVVDAAGGRPRRFTSFPSDEHVPSWSRDGKWIYFTSNRTGRFEEWRMPFSGGAAVQLTDNGGYIGFESWDGKNLYYGKYGEESVYLRSLSGGPERKLLGSIPASNCGPAEEGVYCIERAQKEGPNVSVVRFFDPTFGNSRLVNRFEARNAFGLAVSPDGKSFLYSSRETSNVGMDLMLIENFR